jgi:hypothetical protein
MRPAVQPEVPAPVTASAIILGARSPPAGAAPDHQAMTCGRTSCGLKLLPS